MSVSTEQQCAFHVDFHASRSLCLSRNERKSAPISACIVEVGCRLSLQSDSWSQGVECKLVIDWLFRKWWYIIVNIDTHCNYVFNYYKQTRLSQHESYSVSGRYKQKARLFKLSRRGIVHKLVKLFCFQMFCLQNRFFVPRTTEEHQICATNFGHFACTYAWNNQWAQESNIESFVG